ncbi:MAG: methyl-accepting chemotaxis protein [Ignavibacteriaceae bacterium]
MSRFNNLKIGTKLSLGFISIAFLSTLLSFIVNFETIKISEIIIFLILEILFAMVLGTFVSRNINKTLKNLNCMMREMSKGHICESLNISSKDELGEISEEMNRFNDYLQNSILFNINNIANGNFSSGTSLMDDKDEFSLALNRLSNVYKNLKNETDLMVNAFRDGDTDYRINGNEFSGDYKNIIENINWTINEIVAVVRRGYTIMQKLSEGDLSARMDDEYKGKFNRYKNNINHLGESLESMILDITEIIKATSVSTNEISSSIEEISLGTEEQSQQALEVAGAVEEMTKTILETSRNADAATEASKQYGDIAKDGGKVVNETVDGMNKIAAVVKKSADTVHALGVSSKQIGEIIQVIDEIADQTNLLALNAAIEAARAGEQGRGFAVVADEVRKLAERTTKATKEIASMIKQIQKDTDDAVLSMEEGTSEVEKGKKLADHAGISLKQIIDGADKVVDIVTQVAAASEEQSSASEQISKSIETISSVSQQSSASLQQIASAAENLSRLTGNLESQVSKFKIKGFDNELRLVSKQNKNRNQLNPVNSLE